MMDVETIAILTHDLFCGVKELEFQGSRSAWVRFIFNKRCMAVIKTGKRTHGFD